MVKPDVVRRKVARALDWLDDAEAILSQPSEVFLANTKDQDLASFYLFLAIQECIDLAAHWVADAGWGSPDDAVSTFLLLADRRAIDRALAEGLRGAAGLQNLIAHGYTLVDHARIQSEYREGVSNIRRFLAAVATEAGL
jgi:uncharacterized protein YutE (UPF0331/DUF86 family)